MTTENKAVENYGYHIIDTPEKKAKFAPKMATDEFLSEGWSPVTEGFVPDGIFSKGNIYRRPVAMEPGYRRVELDEVLVASDEFTYNGTEWKQWRFSLQYTPRTEMKDFPDTSIICFRRKIESSIDGWVTLRHPLDTPPILPGSRVWFIGSDGMVRFCPSYQGEYKHWQKFKLAGDEVPQPPKPTKIDEEVAFEKELEELKRDFFQEHGYRPDMSKVSAGQMRRVRMAFNAGIAFQKSKQTK